MRRVAMRHRGRVVQAVTVVVGVAIVVAGCGGGGGGDRDLARDCMQNPNGVPGVAAPPTAKDLPKAFGKASDPHPMGADGINLLIQPVANVHTIRKECFTGKVGYFAARIEYAPGENRQLKEWKNWTTSSGPAYLFVEAPSVSTATFDFDIYMKDATGNLVSLKHGQGFYKDDANAPPDAANIGLPYTHLSDQSYLRKLREVGGDSMAAVAERVRAQPAGSGSTAKPLDDPNAWFNCAQGCCTATAIM